jgi:hypothetical protein
MPHLGTWQEADLCNVIKEAISQIDYKMVKSWFKFSFRKMYPKRAFPLYLK